MKTLKIKPLFIKAFGIAAAVSIMASCTEKIDIELDESYARLVVEGSITTDTTSHLIKLTRSTSYFYPEQAPGVSGAVLTIDNGSDIITLSETEPGVYATPEDYHGLPGREYILSIKLSEPIGGFDNYTASSYMNNPAPLDSIKAVFRSDWGPDGFYEITCYVQDSTSVDFYMFNVLKNGELMSDTLNKVFVTDDRFYNGNYTNGIGIGYLNQSYERQRVNPGDVLAIESARITEEYFRFVTQLQMQSGFQSPLFSGPPSNIKGNISNGGIGFFATYPVSYTSTIAGEVEIK
jgi:hypothetical protein